MDTITPTTIVKAIQGLGGEGSRQAIRKYIEANFDQVGTSAEEQTKLAIREGVKEGLFFFTHGPSSSLRLEPRKGMQRPPQGDTVGSRGRHWAGRIPADRVHIQ